MVEFFIYTLCSGIACFGYSKLFAQVIDDTAEGMGYVFIGEKSKIKFGKRCLNFASNFIPVISTLAAIAYLGLSIYLCFGDKNNIEDIFKKNPRYMKAGDAKNILEDREKYFTIDTLQDAMKLDGADDKTISNEIKKIKDEGLVPTSKELNKVRSMSDAASWLENLEQDVDLNSREKDELYSDYVKDFSGSTSNSKVLKKTLRIAENKED